MAWRESLNVADAADYLGITKDSLYKLLENGSKKCPPALKLGGTWTFDKADLDKWIEVNKTNRI